MSTATPMNFSVTPSHMTQNDIIRVLGEYTFIRLDNGDEAFFHHGNWITGADVTNGAKVIHIRRLKSDPGVNLLS